MMQHFTAVFLPFLVSMFISAVSFFISIKNTFLRENQISAVISISLSIILGVLPLASFFWYPFDFVAAINFWQYIIPPLASLLIIGSLFIQKDFAVATATLAASLLSVFAGNFEIIIFPELPLILNQLLAAAILCLFALGWRSLSGLNPLPQVQAISVCSGFVLLYAIGSAPLILGLSAAGLLGALIIAYLHSRLQPFGLKTTPFLGFVIGWLGLLSYNEYLFPCFIIFCMLYLIELCISTLRKITFLDKYKEIAYNSICVQAFLSGLSAYSIIRIIWSTCILLILFGLFQTNAENSYSIPVFSGIIVAWQLYRALNWQTANKTLKETNAEVVNEIKKALSQFLPKDKGDTPDKTDKD